MEGALGNRRPRLARKQSLPAHGVPKPLPVLAGERGHYGPLEHAQIVLNVGFEATSGLQLGNEFIEFKARFGGVPREIVVPVTHVVAIYARENGQGMAFPPPPKTPSASPALVQGAVQPPATREPLRSVTADAPGDVDPSGPETPPAGPGQGGRPQLKRVK